MLHLPTIVKMNRTLFLFLILLVLFSCKPQDEKNTKNLLSGEMINNPAQILFDTLSHDFGNINEGDKPAYEFKFKNISKNPLVITEVHASCGCTTPFWPKDIIKPSESNEIKVEYDSEGRPGKFKKSITVTANTQPNITTLSISGEVIPK